jgi:hypothetical protein
VQNNEYGEQEPGGSIIRSGHSSVVCWQQNSVSKNSVVLVPLATRHSRWFLAFRAGLTSFHLLAAMSSVLARCWLGGTSTTQDNTTCRLSWRRDHLGMQWQTESQRRRAVPDVAQTARRAVRPASAARFSNQRSGLAWRWRYRAANTYGSDARKDELKASAHGHGHGQGCRATTSACHEYVLRASDAFASLPVSMRVW